MGPQLLIVNTWFDLVNLDIYQDTVKITTLVSQIKDPGRLLFFQKKGSWAALD